MRPDWITTLASTLRTRERQFGSSAANQPARKSEVLAFSVQAVVSHLEELPEFSAGSGLVPLNDLAASLLELSSGGKPDLLASAPGRYRPDTPKRQGIKLICAAGVRALADHGMKVTQACELIASELACHHIRGRQGGTLSWNTVYHWYRIHRMQAAGRLEVANQITAWTNELSQPWDRRKILTAIVKEALEDAE